MSFASLCAFNYAYPVSFLSKCHAKSRKEVLVVRTSYRKEVLALFLCSREEVLAVSRTQAQDPQSAEAKRSSCACIIFGLYCIHERGGTDVHCRYPARSFIFNSDIETKQMLIKSINTCTCKTAHDNPYCKQPLIQKRYLQCTRDKREIYRETVLVSCETILVSRDTSLVSRDTSLVSCETVVTYI